MDSCTYSSYSSTFGGITETKTIEIYRETRFEGYDKLTFNSSDISKKNKLHASTFMQFQQQGKKSRRRL